MNKTKLFPCYSISLRDFLASHGIKYELVGLHPETYKILYLIIIQLLKQAKNMVVPIIAFIKL